MALYQKHLKNLNHQAKIKRLRRLLATGTAVAALATVGFNKTQVHADEVQKDVVKQSTPATQKLAAASSAARDSQTSSSSAASSSSESSTDKAANDRAKVAQSSSSSSSVSSISDASSTKASSAASETSSRAESKTDAQTTSATDTENQKAASAASSTESDTATSAAAATSATESKASSAVSDSAKTESTNTDTESSAKTADTSVTQNASSAESQRKTNAKTADSKSTTKTESAKDPVKVDNRKTTKNDVNTKTASFASKTAQKTATRKTKTTHSAVKATKTPAKQNKFAVYAVDENPVNVANLTSTQINFLNSIKKAAINGWNQYGVLPSLTAAQAILESGWGQSSLATKYHNLFGIKGSYNGKTVNLPTQEYIHGKYVTIDDYFRVYQNNGESLADHLKFLVDNSRYANLLKVKDSDTVTSLISQDGYATASNYTASLRELISEYKLNDWDTLAFDSNNSEKTKTAKTTTTTVNVTKHATKHVTKHVTKHATKHATTTRSAKTTSNSYTVKSGDTLWALANRYNTTISNLKSHNGLTSDTIHIGQKLKLN